MPVANILSSIIHPSCLYPFANHCHTYLRRTKPAYPLPTRQLKRLDKKMGESPIIDRDALTESQKWSYITDNTLKMMSFGFLCGGAVSMIVFRSVASRAAVTAFGTGCGIGKSYVDTKYVLGHDIAAETVWSAQVAPPKSST
ncbi:hypothetical protein LSCM1_04661 [Leishmania martiniquensis]|uniref:MICOS complex subunit MIC10 n=1 Tax=Leishmania martiniquensis TaxID=1580590 RepID=A0A836GQE4_9TRYP|nr:hypothetical protein LSCM1_04661 [Leishmania martiniquensis]